MRVPRFRPPITQAGTASGIRNPQFRIVLTFSDILLHNHGTPRKSSRVKPSCPEFSRVSNLAAILHCGYLSFDPLKSRLELALGRLSLNWRCAVNSRTPRGGGGGEGERGYIACDGGISHLSAGADLCDEYCREKKTMSPTVRIVSCLI